MDRTGKVQARKVLDFGKSSSSGSTKTELEVWLRLPGAWWISFSRKTKLSSLGYQWTSLHTVFLWSVLEGTVNPKPWE